MSDNLSIASWVLHWSIVQQYGLFTLTSPSHGAIWFLENDQLELQLSWKVQSFVVGQGATVGRRHSRVTELQGIKECGRQVLHAQQHTPQSPNGGRLQPPFPYGPAQCLASILQAAPVLHTFIPRSLHPHCGQRAPGSAVRGREGWPAGRLYPRQHCSGVCIRAALSTGYSEAEQGVWLPERV